MKVAVSIPDAIFTEADATAQRLGVARSELYARALAAYLRQRRGDDITANLNRVYKRASSRVDPVLNAMQLRSLPREDW